MNSRRRTSRRAFSLVELLVVVAVMSVLAGLSVSTMSLWRSESLTASGNRMADLVALARQNSLAKSTSTAIAIKVQNESAYSAVCLLEYFRTEEGSSGDWKMLVPWTSLKDGVVFAPDTTNTFISSGTNVSARPDNFPSEILFRGQAAKASSMAVQVYQPDGTLSVGQMLRLRLAEGVAAASGDGVALTHPASSGQPANYYDIVFLRDTGQIKIERQ